MVKFKGSLALESGIDVFNRMKDNTNGPKPKIQEDAIMKCVGMAVHHKSDPGAMPSM